jgi:hypothetical protein
VELFTSYQRRSHICKTGVGDVLIGAGSSWWPDGNHAGGDRLLYFWNRSDTGCHLTARADVPTEDRRHMAFLIENMTKGRNAVG